MRITNRVKQIIPIQVRKPDGDFFAEEQQFRIQSGKSVDLPKRYLNMAQIENLKARGDISAVVIN